MPAYQQSTLWKTAFPEGCTEYTAQRKRLTEAYERFHERVAQLLGLIKAELPDLTLHDITHVDALWRVASEIAGPDYPLNPAEALLLGGAFLLHDAAHCRAAYPGGLAQLQATAEWRDSAAQRKLDPTTLTEGGKDFQAVLFDTLRTLHPRQARELPFAEWKDSDGTTLRLFPDDELRDAYGDLIGQIAQSHWSHPHELEVFAKSTVTAPSCLSPANWTVDPLKLAILLRVADACHMDAKRAPRFLMLLKQPQGISSQHWRFQSKLHQVKCDSEREELILSGSPFPASEQAAWWLAYDAACLADRELSAADSLLRDHHGQRLAAREIAGIKSPQSFARKVPTKDWYPVDTSLRISNIQSVVERFGGEKLYGDKPWLALRELIQNARDAIHAARSLGYLNEDEGEIEVAIEDTDDGHWLHVTDNGIGMSRYVLTEVLLDFGHSLWRSADLSGEWSGLAASGFEAVGQFGIGFFSVFMLGEKVRVCTRRSEAKDDENDRGWVLEFNQGIKSRALLREPNPDEKLKKPGSKISVFLTEEIKKQLCLKEDVILGKGGTRDIAQTCAHLAPAIDLNLYVRENTHRTLVVSANDWKKLPQYELLQRIYPFTYSNDNLSRFKDWLHLTEIKNSSGILAGRCAILAGHLGKAALGVTKGIFGGYIQGMSGVIFSAPQQDLARQKAIPDITKRSLQDWAEAQKNTLYELGELYKGRSKLLAHYGASHCQLTIGTLGNEEITQQEFVKHLNELDELIVHDQEIEHESDDDVRANQFDEFSAEKNVLELGTGGFFNTDPSWVKEIPDGGVNTDSWSIQAAFNDALHSAWGDEDHWIEDRKVVSVGYVNGTPIDRICDVYTREDFSD